MVTWDMITINTNYHPHTLYISNQRVYDLYHYYSNTLINLQTNYGNIRYNNRHSSCQPRYRSID